MTLLQENLTTAPNLRVTGLCVTFRDPTGEPVHVVDSLSFTASPGQLVCLVGRSGSGKTSVLRRLLRLDGCSPGSVCWDEQDVSALTESEAADFRRTRVAYVDQNSALVEELTVLENALLPLLPDGRDRVRENTDHALELLTLFGLDRRVRWRPRQLSGGERQRVGLVRAMVGRAPGIVADEPTASLDRRWAARVTTALRQHADNGGLVVAASHDRSLADAADVIIHLG